MQLLKIKLKESKNIMSKERNIFDRVITDHYGIVRGFVDRYGSDYDPAGANKLLAEAQRDILRATNMGLIAELLNDGYIRLSQTPNNRLFIPNQGYVGIIDPSLIGGLCGTVLSANGEVNVKTDPIGKAFRPDYAVMALIKALRAMFPGDPVDIASRLGTTLGFYKRPGGELIYGATGFIPNPRSMEVLRSSNIVRAALEVEPEEVFRGSGLADHIMADVWQGVVTDNRLAALAESLVDRGVGIN
jgi:hypothetical protein